MNPQRALPFLLAVLAGGCYSATNGRALEQRVLATEAWQDEFRRAYDQERNATAASLLEAEQAIVALRTDLVQTRDSHQRLLADLGARLDAIAADINAVRGRAEEGSHSDSRLRQEIELLRQEIEIQLAAIRGR